MQGIFDACGFADSIAKGTEMQRGKMEIPELVK